MFIKRISEVVSVRVIQRLRCSTLSNEFLIERELISKYRKYDFHASTYVHVHAQEINSAQITSNLLDHMRKSSCDLKTRTRIRQTFRGTSSLIASL